MNTSRTSRPPRSGFSLVEVVVALGIFSFAILSVIGLMGASLKSTSDNEARIQAANTATIVMARYQELLKADKRSESPNWGTTFSLPSNGVGDTLGGAPQMIDQLGNKVADADGASFGMTYAINRQAVEDGSKSEIVRCTVQLQWPTLTAAAGGPVNTFTATTAFLLTP